MSLTSRSTPVSYLFYPHIVETILSYCDYTTLLRFRATCRSLKALAHRALHDGHLTIGVEGSFIDLKFFADEFDPCQPPPPPCQTPTVVMRGAVGVLPFRTEADWTWACEHSREVDIDGACLSMSTRIVPDPTQGFRIRQPKTHKNTEHLPDPSNSESVTIQAGLLRALSRTPRTSSATITHSYQHGPPAYLPPTESLTLRTDPLCDCLVVKFRLRPELQPQHSAKHITLRVPDAWNGEDHMACCCNLAFALLQPSVERLTLSIDRTLSTFQKHEYSQDFGFILYELEERGSRGNIKSIEVELRPRKPGSMDEVLAEQIKAQCAQRCHVDSDEVHIVYSPTAGDPRPYTRPF